MAQIVHDVAPGAKLAFHTAFLGQANFVQGIKDLAAAGADIIVDGLSNMVEPWFQDGVAAQTVDQMHAMGVAYFTTASNDSRQATSLPTTRSFGTAVGVQGEHEIGGTL
jgi:hypothetical protein